MRHFIIGTAGHIDHGKTSLIEALTGKETDRLKEEKERGISIELGFTYFDLKNGKRAGIIDVPGHEKFIKNMLSGVVGIDIVILVVAADESVMPQTIEHLEILDLIGVEKGFIVINKVDLVEEDWLKLVEEDIRTAVKSSFLEDSPILKVSSKTGEGIKKVSKLIEDYSDNLEEKSINEHPRLPIDRAFTIAGFGTIVTGTLISGSFKLGEEVEVYPRGIKARIRSIQVHGEDEDKAYAGQRVAINLAGVDKESISRGDVLALPNTMVNTSILDVKLSILNSIEKPIKNRSRLRLYIGSKEVFCRIILLDKKMLKAGETAYAQLLLEEDIAVKIEDRFVIRFYSPMFTIGGGRVLDSNPSRKKRFDKSALEELEIKDRGNPKDIVENVILESRDRFVKNTDIISNLHLLEEDIRNIVDQLLKDKKIIEIKLLNESYYIHASNYKYLIDLIEKELSNYHSLYPLRIGMLKEELRSKYLNQIPKKAGEIFLHILESDGYIDQDKEYVKIKDYSPSLSEEDELIGKKVVDYIEEDYKLKKNKDIISYIKIDKDHTEEILRYLLNKNELVKLDNENYISREQLKGVQEILENYLNTHEKIDVAKFRDLLDTNRKISISLLEYFDRKKVTKRIENHRVLL